MRRRMFSTFLNLLIVNAKIQIKSIPYIIFLTTSLAIFLPFVEFSNYIAQFNLGENALTGALILTFVFGYVFASSLDVQRNLKIESFPAVKSKKMAVGCVNVFMFSPHILSLSLALFKVVGIASLLYMLLGFTLALLLFVEADYLIPPVAILLLASQHSKEFTIFTLGILLAVPVMRRISTTLSTINRVLILWIRFKPITLTHPTFALIPILSILATIFFISTTSENIKVSVSPLGGEVAYVYTNIKPTTFTLGGVVAGFALFLSLAVSLFYASIRYLDRYIWKLKYLRGTLMWFPLNLILNTVYGLTLTATIFGFLHVIGVGHLTGTFLVASISILVAVILAPTLDDSRTIGNFLLCYLLLGFTIAAFPGMNLMLINHEAYLLLATLPLACAMMVLWFRLKVLSEKLGVRS